MIITDSKLNNNLIILIMNYELLWIENFWFCTEKEALLFAYIVYTPQCKS
jgi:hypothetical protein